MKRTIVSVMVLTLVFGLWGGGLAKASFISPVSAVMSGDVNAVLPASNLIGDASSVAYVQTSSANMWVGDTGSTTANPPQVLLTFDLGQRYDIGSLYVWAFNYPGSYQIQQRSVADFDLLGSADGGSYSPIGSFTSQYVGDTSDLTVQTFALNGANDVRYLRMSIKSNWLNGWRALTPYTVVGLGEVAFEGTSVPEPVTMILLGLGSLFLRRRTA